MKLQQTSQKIEQNQISIRKQNLQSAKHSNTSFNGGMDVFLNFLQTNQGVGATFVDAAFMCTPRTIIDFTRGPEAGTETARREFASNINDASLGLYGMGAAALATIGINRAYGIKANKMHVDDVMLDVLGDFRAQAGDLNKKANLRKYLGKVFDNLRGFNPNKVGSQENSGWVYVDKKVKKAAVEGIIKEFEVPEAEGFFAKIKQKSERKALLKSIIGPSTGVCDEYKVDRWTGKYEKKLVEGKKVKEIKSSISSLDDFVDNLYGVTKAFMQQEVNKTFNAKTVKNAIKDVENNKFLKKMKGVNILTSALGIAACAGLGACVQPFNMYLTKKKTGTTGFVGGGKKDESKGFSVLKKTVAGVAGYAMLRTIGKLRDIPTKIQFKGVWPTIPQFKLVYGITIVSRLLSARNQNELREATIKDSLGFANWLILGGFATKLTALAIEKSAKFKEAGVKLTKYNAKESTMDIPLIDKKFRKPKFIGASVISREELLRDSLAKAGIELIDKQNGKAMSFKEMLKKVAEVDLKIAKGEIKNITKIKPRLRALALAQIAGYAWSALALGIGIPKLNIAITNSVEGKKKAPQKTK